MVSDPAIGHGEEPLKELVVQVVAMVRVPELAQDLWREPVALDPARSPPTSPAGRFVDFTETDSYASSMVTLTKKDAARNFMMEPFEKLPSAVR